LTAQRLLAEAEARGVRFRIIGDKLLAAPASVFDAALKEGVRLHKTAVMDELRRRAPTDDESERLAVGCDNLRVTCPRYVVADSALEFAEKGACISCGGSWELHGEPPRNLWHVVDDVEAVLPIKIQYVLAKAIAIVADAKL
jgi:hypothetical protein